MVAKTAITTETTPELFDLRVLKGGPAATHDINAKAIPIIGGAALALLREHPEARARWDTDRLAHILWERVRRLPYDTAPGCSIDAALSVPAIAGPVSALGRILDLLVDAGDLKATLLAQRAALDAQIAQLEGRQPTGSAAA